MLILPADRKNTKIILKTLKKRNSSEDFSNITEEYKKPTFVGGLSVKFGNKDHSLLSISKLTKKFNPIRILI